jgi:hypothetical protein
MTTITATTTRSGQPAWVVTWGKGLTQTAIALSYLHAVALALTRGERGYGPEPLVEFRDS